jgi:hypothetical protein
VTLLLVALSFVFLANALTIRSPLAGTAITIVFLCISSWVFGRLLYQSETRIFQATFGFITFLIVLALTGNFLIVIGGFTEIVSLSAIIALSVILSLVFARFRKKVSPKASGESKVSQEKKLTREAILFLALFLAFTALEFWMLLLGRTEEGGASVWLTISSYFVPLFFLGTFSLIAVVVFARIGNSLKLVLVCIYSFLVHSLFLIVWYPGRYGDPWIHLGEARYIARTGFPFGYSWMVNQFLVAELALRVQEALTVFLGRMSLLDLYWIHVTLVPLLWSILLPLIAYKIAEMLTIKKSKAFPILAAVSTLFFPNLILWGTVSVPNSIGFLFAFVTLALLLIWMNQGDKRIWLSALLASAASFLSHPQAGIFAFMLFLWVTVLQKTTRKIWSIVGYALLFTIYPLALIARQASFSLGELLILDNFLYFQSQISTILLIFGVAGLILGVKYRLVKTKSALVLFIFYATILLEYYLTEFGMTGLPYGPGRIVTMADFALVPFVAMGLFSIPRVFGKMAAKSNVNSLLGKPQGRFKIRLGRRSIGFLAICLFFSLQATAALYQAYPHSEIVKVQPSSYELEAVQFIDSDSAGRYVVLCEPTFAGLAIGFLGADHGYIGSGRGAFGIPELWYTIAQRYVAMTEQPSVGIIQDALREANAAVGYFVVSERSADFESIVQRTLDAFGEPYGTFGSNKLYVWRYPLRIIEEPGLNVKVTFEDGNSTYVQTKFVSMFKSEANSTLALSGHSSYYISEYPMNWTFLGLTVDGERRNFDDSSDVNSFIYISGLNSNNTVILTWLFNRNYPRVGWKDDSFKNGWAPHPIYTGSIQPSITTDGNILTLSYLFKSDVSAEYYYYTKAVNVSTDDFNYVLVRWKSNGPVAVAAVYYGAELWNAEYIVRVGSQSDGWATTVVELPSGRMLSYVMVGISDFGAKNAAGTLTLQVDYVMIAAKTSP